MLIANLSALVAATIAFLQQSPEEIRAAKPEIFAFVAEADELPEASSIPTGSSLEVIRLVGVRNSERHVFIQAYRKDAGDEFGSYALMTVKVLSEYHYDGERLSQAIVQYPIDLSEDDWNELQPAFFEGEFTNLGFTDETQCDAFGRYWLEVYDNGALHEVVREKCDATTSDASPYVSLLISIADRNRPGIATEIQSTMTIGKKDQ